MKDTELYKILKCIDRMDDVHRYKSFGYVSIGEIIRWNSLEDIYAKWDSIDPIYKKRI